MKCRNDKCSNDPLKSMNIIFVGIDGDAVCNKKCLEEYKNQYEYFMNTIVQDPKLTEGYLRGETKIC